MKFARRPSIESLARVLLSEDKAEVREALVTSALSHFTTPFSEQ
jgi:hypothetical protein